MSGSNRGLIIAAVGVLAFGFGAGITSLNYVQHEHEKAVAANQQRARDEGRQQQSNTDHAGVPGPAQRFISNPEPADGTEREKRDLAAQENTAAWAFWIVILTGGQLLLSIAGLWALLRTIEQGRIALKRARRANRIARDTARRQLRAYVDVGHVKLGPQVADEQMYAEIAFTNHGQTPAYHAEIDSSLFVLESPIDEALLVHNPVADETPSRATIGSSRPIAAKPHTGTNITQDHINAMAAGAFVAIVFGVLRYKDAFDCDRETQFRYVYDPKLEMMIACERGNDST